MITTYTTSGSGAEGYIRIRFHIGLVEEPLRYELLRLGEVLGIPVHPEGENSNGHVFWHYPVICNGTT